MKPKPTPADTAPWRVLLGICKDLLPFLALIVSAIYGYGVRASTADRLDQQVQENRATITMIREKLDEIDRREARLEGQLWERHDDKPPR